MEKHELTPLLPRNGSDIAAAKQIVELGYPAVAPVLKSLFQWLETSGSPVEVVLRPFFAELGEPALDLVRDALTAKIKPARKEALLRFVLPHWPRPLIESLENELMALVLGTEFHGLDVHSLALLVRKQVGDAEELTRWRDFKIQRMQGHLDVLHSISTGT